MKCYNFNKISFYQQFSINARGSTNPFFVDSDQSLGNAVAPPAFFTNRLDFSFFNQMIKGCL
jgi:hypothetical protein